jgi:hypothetical protein
LRELSLKKLALASASELEEVEFLSAWQQRRLRNVVAMFLEN